MARFFKFAALGLLPLATALPSSAELGISFESGNEDAPLLKLDYGTYRGNYNSTAGVVVFKNIRFAAPPVGELRWAKPAPPIVSTQVHDGSEGRSCTQSRAAAAASPTAPGEDCLFLDLTVPMAAIKDPSKKLPVVDWVYGGAYIVGSKEQRGDAATMINAAKGNLIWVAGNYRLGAYGFLAGTTVEKEGFPNAGFWDQRAVLEWIQKYIHLVGGDKKSVTAMGISAGAGSILHHLVFEGGAMDPLFNRAILQSPGYTNYIDRKGQLENNFKRFEEIAGCKGKGLACLRKLDGAALKEASTKANSGQRQGTFAFGPAPDGKLIVDTPTLEFEKGRYWKTIDSIISSHVADEGGSFTDSKIDTDEKFNALLSESFGNSSELAPLKERIKKIYPPISSPLSTAKTERQRLGKYVSDSSFICHNRLIADHYPGQVYSVRYAVSPGTHGSDQTGTFYNPNNPRYASLSKAEREGRQAYQSYLVSYAVTGDPNTQRDKKVTVEWPRTTGLDQPALAGVLNVADLTGLKGLSIVSDPDQLKENCKVWTDIQHALHKVLG